MKETLQHFSQGEGHVIATSPTRAIVVGLIGGLVGTLVMDLFGGGLFLLLGGPASLSFSIIGDAAAGFISMLGVQVAGGAPLGTVLHYLIGLILGCILVTIVLRTETLRLDTVKKGIILGIVYVELISLPMLAAAAIVLTMTVSETAQWFGISFVMHLVYGLVLGAVVSHGLRVNETGKDKVLMPRAGEHGL